MAFEYRNKKLLFILAHFQLGGAERQAINLAHLLKNEKGALVEIWGFSAQGPAMDLARELGLPCRAIKKYSRLGFVGKIIRYSLFLFNLYRYNPCILFPFTNQPNVICGLYWRISGAKLCIWNQRDPGLQRKLKFLELLSIKNTPILISNSLAGAKFLECEYSIPKEKIHIIPNSVFMDFPRNNRNEWRETLGVYNDTFVVTMVANLYNSKDHKTLLKGWSIAIKQLSDIHLSALLVLAGHLGDTTDELIQLAKELQISDSVKFLGFVKDISGLLLSSDLAVLSSREEANPNGLLEPMSLGLPIVATDNLGIRETVGPENIHSLFPPSHPEALAAKIIMYASDKELRIKQGLINKERIANFFSSKKMLDSYDNLIEKAFVGKF